MARKRVFATIEFDIEYTDGKEQELGNVVRAVLNQMNYHKENARHGYNIYIQNIKYNYIIDEKGKSL